MQTIRKINDEIAIAGQITSDQLQQLTQDGFRSVLNLRSPDEPTFFPDEPEKAAYLDLQYCNFPVRSEALDNQTATGVLLKVAELPKPLLIHCHTATRAAAIALIYVATQQGIALENALAQVKQFGLIGIPNSTNA